MFVFSRLNELDIAVNEINQQLFRKCPELRVKYIVSDCLELDLVKSDKAGRRVVGLCLRNGDENAIMAGVTFFYRVLALNNRPRSKQNVEKLFEGILDGVFYRWD